MSHNKTATIFFCFLTLSLFSQEHKCGFKYVDSLHSGLQKTIESVLSNRKARLNTVLDNQTFKIPVVVHVVHNGTSEIGFENNISDEQIFSAIKVLNEDFQRKNADTVLTPPWARPVAANMQIEFILASQDPIGTTTNGITRHKTDVPFFSFPKDDKKLKSYGFWPSEQYLNIWVTPLRLDGSNEGLIGYAQFPDNSGLAGLENEVSGALTDGVVIAPNAFGRLIGKATGNKNPYRFGRTAVHEVGHWLGLLHTFDDFGLGCNYTDYCNDTPSQSKSSSGQSICTEDIIGDCGTKVMFSNFMDYTNDACMNIFTDDQKKRVRTVLEVSPRRSALKFSRGLCGSNNKIELPYKEDFENEVSLIKNIKLSTSKATDGWAIEQGVLYANTISTAQKDSLVFQTGLFRYTKSSKLTLRFKLNTIIGKADSIKVFYSVSCSEVLKLFKKIDLINSESKEYIFPVGSAIDEGLLSFYIVVYSNGNKIGVDDLYLYEESEKLNVSIYPNPSKNGIFNYTIALPNEQDVVIEVFDELGKNIFENTLRTFSGSYLLDLSFLQSGIYFAKFSDSSNSNSFKIVIE